jgi:hypothetical protein
MRSKSLLAHQLLKLVSLSSKIKLGQIYHLSRMFMLHVTLEESVGLNVMSTKLVSPVFVMFLVMSFRIVSMLDMSTLSPIFNGHSRSMTKSLVLWLPVTVISATCKVCDRAFCQANRQITSIPTCTDFKESDVQKIHERVEPILKINTSIATLVEKRNYILMTL